MITMDLTTDRLQIRILKMRTFQMKYFLQRETKQIRNVKRRGKI